MGLEIPDEFFPITPIRTSITRNLNSTVSPLSVNNTKEKNEKKNHHHHHDRMNKKAKSIIIDENCNDFGHEFTKLPDLVSTTNLQQDLANTTEFSQVVKAKEDCEEKECSTPKSEDKLLKTPLVCPPAPRKPKPLKRKNGFSSSTGLFYQQVPMDLTSVFFAVPPSSKKIRAG